MQCYAHTMLKERQMYDGMYVADHKDILKEICSLWRQLCFPCVGEQSCIMYDVRHGVMPHGHVTSTLQCHQCYQDVTIHWWLSGDSLISHLGSVIDLQFRK